MERNAFAEDDDSLQGAPLHVVLLVLTPRCKSTNSLEIVIASKKVIEYGRYSGSKRHHTSVTMDYYIATILVVEISLQYTLAGMEEDVEDEWHRIFFERELADVEQSWQLRLIQISESEEKTKEFEAHWRKQLEIEALEFSNELLWALHDNSSEKNIQNIFLSEFYRSEGRKVPPISKFCEEGVCSGCNNCDTKAKSCDATEEKDSAEPAWLWLDGARVCRLECSDEENMVGDAWSERLETDVDRSVQLMMDEKARVAHGMREVLGTVNQAMAMKEQMNYIDAKLQQYDPDNDDTMVSEFKPTYGFVNRFMLLCAANDLTSKVAAPLGPSYRHNLALYSLDTFYSS